MVKSAHNAGDLGSIPWSGRVPWGKNGYTLQYSCLENPMDGRAWRAAYPMALQRVRHERLTSTYTHLPPLDFNEDEGVRILDSQKFIVREEIGG